MKNDSLMIRSVGILNRTFLSYMTHVLQEKEISYSESIIIVNIGHSLGITQDEIATQLALDKSAITRSVKVLIEKGYVFIKTSEQDKRFKHLYLTELGQSYYFYLDKANNKWLERLFNDISDSDKKTFSEVIKRISEVAINTSK